MKEGVKHHGGADSYFRQREYIIPRQALALKIKQYFTANQSCKHKGNIYSSVIHSGNVPRSPSIEDMGKFLEQKKRTILNFKRSIANICVCIYKYINFSSDSSFSVANMYIHYMHIYFHVHANVCVCIYLLQMYIYIYA